MPTQNPYSDKLHGALKEAYGDSFSLTEEQFLEKMNSDVAYRDKIYGAFQEAYGDGFTLTPEQFAEKLKKKGVSGQGSDPLTQPLPVKTVPAKVAAKGQATNVKPAPQKQAPAGMQGDPFANQQVPASVGYDARLVRESIKGVKEGLDKTYRIAQEGKRKGFFDSWNTQQAYSYIKPSVDYTEQMLDKIKNIQDPEIQALYTELKNANTQMKDMVGQAWNDGWDESSVNQYIGGLNRDISNKLDEVDRRMAQLQQPTEQEKKTQETFQKAKFAAPKKEALPAKTEQEIKEEKELEAMPDSGLRLPEKGEVEKYLEGRTYAEKRADFESDPTLTRMYSSYDEYVALGKLGTKYAGEKVSKEQFAEGRDLLFELNTNKQIKAQAETLEATMGQRHKDVNFSAYQENFNQLYDAWNKSWSEDPESEESKILSKDLREAQSAMNEAYKNLDLDYLESMKATQPTLATENIDRYNKISQRLAAGEEVGDSEMQFLYDTRKQALTAYGVMENAKLIKLKENADIPGYTKMMAEITPLFQEVLGQQDLVKYASEQQMKQAKATMAPIQEEYGKKRRELSDYESQLKDIDAQLAQLDAEYQLGMKTQQEYEYGFNQLSSARNNVYGLYSTTYSALEELNKAMETAIAPFNTEISKIQDPYNKKIAELNKAIADIKKKTGVDDSVLAQLDIAYKNIATVDLGIKTTNAQFSKQNYSEELNKMLEKQRKEDGSIIGEMVRGFTSGMANIALGAMKLPKGIGLEDSSEYGFVDKLYYDAMQLQKEASGTWGGLTGDDVPFWLAQAYGIGNGVASTYTYAMGGAIPISSLATSAATTFVLSAGDNYQRAIDAGFDTGEAQIFSNLMTLTQAGAEMIYNDVNVFDDVVGNTILRNVTKNGLTLKQATKVAFEQLPKNAAKMSKAIKMELLEEGTALFAEKLVLNTTNTMAGKKYFEDATLSTKEVEETFITTAGSTIITRMIGRRSKLDPNSRMALFKSVENSQKALENAERNNLDKAEIANIKKTLDEAKLKLSVVESHTNWPRMTDEQKAYAFDVARQLELNEKAVKSNAQNGIQDESLNQQTEELRQELNDALNNPEAVEQQEQTKSNTLEVLEAIKNGEDYTQMVSQHPNWNSLSDAEKKEIESLSEDLEEKQREILSLFEVGVESSSTIEQRDAIENKIAEILNKPKNDQKDIQGVSGEVREGEEPVQAEPVATEGEGETEAGGVLQAPGQEEVTPTTEVATISNAERRDEEIRKRGLDRLFPITIDETTPEGKKLAKEKAEQEDKIKQLDAELAASEAQPTTEVTTPSTETVTRISEVAPAVRRVGAVEASEGNNQNAGDESALEGVGMDNASLNEWKKKNRISNKKGRIEELAQAVRDLMSGKIKFKEYYEKAKKAMPSKLMDKVPTPATNEEVVGSVDRNKIGIGIINLNKFVKKGMKVGLRIDIPAFYNFGKHVVTVHDRSGSGQPVIGYGSTGSIKNVNFRTSVSTAAKIAAGESKSPFAMAQGEWMDESPESIQKRAEEALNSPEWVQVGMNPTRNSFFFDKADGNPVVSADEVLQVGNLVLAKNPKKIDLNTTEGMAEFEKMFSAKSAEGVTYQFREGEGTTTTAPEAAAETEEVSPEIAKIEEQRAAELEAFENDENLTEIDGEQVLLTPDGRITSDTINKKYDKRVNFQKEIEAAVAEVKKQQNPEYQAALREAIDADPQATTEVHQMAAENILNGANAADAIATAKQEATQKARAEKARQAMEREGLVSTDEEIDKSIENVSRALRSTGIRVKLIKDPAKFEEERKKAKASDTAEAWFRSKTGEIVLSLPALKAGWGSTIVFHEGTHPIINIVRNTNKPLYDKVIKGLRDAAKKEKLNGKPNPLKDVEAWVQKAAGNKTQEQQDDEFITETIARLASGDIEIKRLPLTLKDKLIEFLNKMAKFMGFKRVFLNSPDYEFRRLANQIATTLAKGERIEKVVGKRNVKKYQAKFGSQESTSAIFDDVATKLAALGIEIGPGKKKKTNFDVGKALKEYYKKKFKSMKIDDFGKKAVDLTSDYAVDEILFALNKFGNSSGKGWYTEDFEKALNTLAQIDPDIKNDPKVREIATVVIAIASNSTDVLTNLTRVIYAVNNYKKTGKIPTDVGSGKGASAIATGVARYNLLLDKFNGDVEKVKQFMQTVGPIKDVRQQLIDLTGKKSFAQVKKDNLATDPEWNDTEVLPGSILIFGPKIGAFYSNLSGLGGTPTIDRWCIRTIYRYRGDMMAKALPSEIEQFKKDNGLEGQSDGSVIALIEDHAKAFNDILTGRGEFKGMPKEDRNKALKQFRKGSQIAAKMGNVVNEISDGLNDKIENKAQYSKDFRSFTKKVFEEAQKKIKEQTGQDLQISDIQAILWIYEKELFGAMGVNQRPDSTYSSASQRLVDSIKNGVNTVEDFKNGKAKTDQKSVTLEEGPMGDLIPMDSGDYVEGLEIQPDRLNEDVDLQNSVPREGERIGKYDVLPGAPTPKDATGPIPELVDVAESYAKKFGIPYTRQAEYVQVNEEFATRIANAYAEMKHDPKDPKVKEAYDDLIRQTTDQYNALMDAGYEFTFFDGKNDPYNGNPMDAMRDLRANKKMAVYGTYDGYGTEGITGANIEDNPMLAPTGLQWPDQSGKMHDVTANDLFRAVHDAFGHGLEGAGFRARGEENAWQAHARLFVGPAVGAITSETRGQNSWLNYGPYGEKNRKATLEETVFAEQKTGLMPEWTWTENVAPAMEQVSVTPGNARISKALGIDDTIQPSDTGRGERFVDKVADALDGKKEQLNTVKNIINKTSSSKFDDYGKQFKTGAVGGIQEVQRAGRQVGDKLKPGKDRRADSFKTREEFFRNIQNSERPALWESGTDEQLRNVLQLNLLSTSNNDFNEFNNRFIGTGISRNALGHGFSFNVNPQFQQALTNSKFKGNPFVYQVRIDGNNFLRSNTKPSIQQLQSIGKLNGIDFTKSNAKNGYELYDEVAKSFGDWNKAKDFSEMDVIENESRRKASEYLSSKGFTGNIFEIDGQNEYLVYDSKNIDIVQKTKIYNSDADLVADQYVKAKEEGSNPELVKAVENLVGEEIIQPSETVGRGEKLVRSGEITESDRQIALYAIQNKMGIKTTNADMIRVSKMSPEQKIKLIEDAFQDKVKKMNPAFRDPEFINQPGTEANRFYQYAVDAKNRVLALVPKETVQPSLPGRFDKSDIPDLIQRSIAGIGADLNKGMSLLEAIENNVTSQDWYPLLSDKEKRQFQSVIESAFEEEVAGIPSEQEEAAEIGVDPNTRQVTSELEDLYYQTRDGNRRQRNQAESRRNEIFRGNPKLSYIYKNFDLLSAQLEERGLLTKSIGCP